MSQPTPGTGVATAPALTAPGRPAPPLASPPALATTSPAAQPAPATDASGRPSLATPQRLQLLSGGMVGLGVLVALAGVVTFGLLALVLGRAEADTEQLVRVQSIQTNLLSADATATNAFLVGGLEPAA